MKVIDEDADEVRDAVTVAVAEAAAASGVDIEEIIEAETNADSFQISILRKYFIKKSHFQNM